MQANSFLGVPVWLWALLVLAVIVVAFLVGNAAARTRKREATEKLAQAADAAHEGALTRHEGGS